MKKLNKSTPILSKELSNLLISQTEKQSFPIGVLPEELQKIVREVSIGHGIHIDHLCSAVLFGFALAIGNSCSISLFENTKKFKPILYMLLISKSGTNKTAALDFATDWFMKKDAESFKKYEKEKKHIFQIDDKNKPKTTGAKTTPVRKQLIFQDATFEALSAGLERNPRGIAMKRDEFKGFLSDLNKYRPGGDFEQYLQLWSQQALITDRASKEISPVYDPFLLLAGTTQPQTLEETLSAVFNNGSGFFERFLLIWPEFMEKAIYQRVDLNEAIKAYEEKLSLIFDFSEKNLKSKRNFSFSPEAEKIILEWLNVYNKNLSDQANNELASLYSKIDIHLLRLALVLHFIFYAFEESPLTSISFSTASKAIKLVEYFRGQSHKVIDFLINADPLLKLRPHQLQLYKKLPEQFKTSEGIAIGLKLGICKRSFQYFLSNNKKLFTSKRTGIYEKI